MNEPPVIAVIEAGLEEIIAAKNVGQARTIAKRLEVKIHEAFCERCLAEQRSRPATPPTKAKNSANPRKKVGLAPRYEGDAGMSRLQRIVRALCRLWPRRHRVTLDVTDLAPGRYTLWFTVSEPAWDGSRVVFSDDPEPEPVAHPGDEKR